MKPLSSPFSPQTGIGNWHPDPELFEWHEGLWRTRNTSVVSYPDSGNESCFQIEDTSYWFRHRMACLLATIERFPPEGMLLDIGGGNGYVAAALQNAGVECALIEPGSGARNAVQRGVRHVIQATLENAHFQAQSWAAAGAFDVVEHIADDVEFLRGIRRQLTPGGRFYCTVPAFSTLWSQEDVHAGHFRRYNRAGLSQVLNQAGFSIEFMTHFFVWLTAPVLFLRALPSRLTPTGRHQVGTSKAVSNDHRLPSLISGLVGRLHAWELNRVRARRPLPFGTSLLCVARANHS
jgi:SAM-dependent methyltransferase